MRIKVVIRKDVDTLRQICSGPLKEKETVNNGCLVFVCDKKPLCLCLSQHTGSLTDVLACLVPSGIVWYLCLLLSLQDWSNPHRGPSPGHQWGQFKRKAAERSHPPPSDGRGVRHAQDQETSRQYVFFLLQFNLIQDLFNCS